MKRNLWIAFVCVGLVLLGVVYEVITHNISWAMVILQVLFLVYALFQFNTR